MYTWTIVWSTCVTWRFALKKQYYFTPSNKYLLLMWTWQENVEMIYSGNKKKIIKCSDMMTTSFTEESVHLFCLCVWNSRKTWKKIKTTCDGNYLCFLSFSAFSLCNKYSWAFSFVKHPFLALYNPWLIKLNCLKDYFLKITKL